MAFDEHIARSESAPDALGGEQALAGWVSEGVAFARSFPPED